ncbi:FAD-linked oxidase [Asanoa ishikariensis]|uniref:FAD/FMN-containing dehydrogenase n=1 Tax=Asanoa ishikariensis TaxID=137265 RepID=A0A1H3UDK2_9ACTN|nr:FAD-binding oxidoreductase [Asanoa ishikariensis]GIF63793.1 FAD-linked oxidase [Asanoa ishikariensis]SDZ60426.1 FAD/FMN-containing dehydrogenase [Asanoa ishikariensis]
MADTTKRTDLTDLAQAVAGPVTLPGDEGYAAETATWNLAAAQRPAVAIGVTSVADVTAAVRFAAGGGLRIVVVATGHGAARGSDGAVMLNVRRMNDIQIDAAARTATIGPGVEAQPLVEAAAEAGLAPLAGSSPNVGVVGYTLGGGLSPTLGRAYGYSADHVRAIEIVTADGTLRQVDAEHEPELFWAVRGGKGNFGVVTALTVELVPVTRLYGGGLYFAAEHTERVVEAYRRLTATAPDTLSVSFAFLRLPPLPFVPEPLRGRFTVHVRFAYLGSAADGERLVADLRATAPTLIDTVAEMPFTGIPEIHADPIDPLPGYEATTLLREFPAEAAKALIAVAGPDADTPALIAEVRQLGGALSREPLVANAVSNRDAGFQFLTGAAAEPGAEEQLRGPLIGILDALAPWATGRAMANFMGTYDATPDGARRAYEPETYTRLARVKHNYDPDNLFRPSLNVIPSPL